MGLKSTDNAHAKLDEFRAVAAASCRRRVPVCGTVATGVNTAPLTVHVADEGAEKGGSNAIAMD